ncbi:DUF742 domain-containing protein [Streptomyces polyrhachis]|uniref:DUF742 domain-containing protein n=1 Tax=Streptomyces polyrhachis TaxID=1282885 RepID=A0ABW2GN51_9ACTN
MTDPAKLESDAAGLVRPYVITKGRDLPEEGKLSLITLVTAAKDDQQRPVGLSPEEQKLLDICTAGYLSVAEIAGHTELPVGVVKILLAALAEGGYLIARPPVERAQQADRQILEEVLNGLRAKFG